MMLMKLLIAPFRLSSAWLLCYALLYSPVEADLLLNEATRSASLASASPSSPHILDFDTAVANTMNQSLNLGIADHEIQARHGRVKQAALYPNPSFNYSLETSELGWHERQEIYSLNQLIEMGGKRQKLKEIASNEYYAAYYGYEATKLERLNQLSRAFIQTVSAQELFHIAVDLQRNSEEFLDITQSKFEAGKISLIEKNKAALSKSLSDLNVRQKRAAFQTAKKNLALLWSASDQDFDFVTYPFYETTPPTSLDDYLAKLCDQPEIVRSLYKYQAAYHNLRYEKSQRVPDVTLTLGYSYDGGDKGIVAGFAVPLPVWNQNQGNIKIARYEMLKSGKEGQLLWKALEAKLSTAYIALMKNYQDAEDIKNTLLKNAAQAFDLALAGYREGKFDYIDVLEAKRTLFDIQEKYIETLVSYHSRLAEIEFLNSQTN